MAFIIHDEEDVILYISKIINFTNLRKFFLRLIQR